MKKSKFDKLIKNLNLLISSIKRTPGVFNYLNSINSMLNAKLYMNSVFDDLNTVINNADKKDNVLDFGSGCGFLSNLLSYNFKRVYGIDTKAVDDIIEKNTKDFPKGFFEDALKAQKKIWSLIEKKRSNVILNHYDGKSLPFKNNFFDNIVAYAVIEHLPSNLVSSILSDINRKMKNGGKLFIFKMPQKWSITEFMAKLLHIGCHIKRFSRKEITSILNKSGWIVENIYYSDFVFEFPASVTNKLYPVLSFLNKVISKTPFKVLAHNFSIICRKK